MIESIARTDRARCAMPLTHLSLFSGIGGFDLAAEWAGFRTVLMCEKDAYCRRVLAKHWPEVPCHDDVYTLTAPVIRARGIGHIDLLTGGFPCQPFSVAGKRRGEGDDRDLWPQMRRVIAEVRPRFVCGENVDNFVNMALDRVCADLEAEGYEVGPPLVFPIAGVGAPHRRYRAFVVAHAHRLRELQPEGGQQDEWGRIGNCGQGAPRQGEGEYWPPEPAVCRTAHGVPCGVDRLRALGNSLSPQQVYPILAAIADQLRGAV